MIYDLRFTICDLRFTIEGIRMSYSVFGTDPATLPYRQVRSWGWGAKHGCGGGDSYCLAAFGCHGHFEDCF